MAEGRDRIREELAGGWRRWEPLFQSFAWPLALRMAAAAQVGDGMRVLDVGCGIGDPTLQIAVLVGPHGRVLGLDVAEDMLATARERAAALGLAHVEFRAADAASAELPAAAFDVVLGRWSVIYMADVPAVLRRLHATLAPEGRIAVSAWAPPEANPWVTVPMQALGGLVALPPTDPAAPGLFHLSADGALGAALTAGGFRRVRQERVVLSLFARDPAEYWAMLTEMGGPLAPLVARLGEGDRAKVVAAVTAALAPFRAGDVYRIPAQAQLAWGVV